MKFERLPNLDSVQIWGAKSGSLSFCVTFDAKHPGYGWRASYSSDPSDVVFVGEGYLSRKAAINALSRAVRQ